MNLTDEQRMNIRMTLAVQTQVPIEEKKALYDWIVGPQTNIVPVHSFQVKQ